MRGQISAEMLVVLAVLIAIAVLVASQLLRTAQQTSAKVGENTGILLNKTDQTIRGACSIEGESCFIDSDCCSGLTCKSKKCEP